MNLKKYILFLFPLLFIQVLMAQDRESIRASVNKNTLLIGEPIRLTIDVFLPAGSTASFVNVDSIAHFEFLGKPEIDSSGNKAGVTVKGVYMITSFDSGHWVLPSFGLSTGQQTDTIPVDVVFAAFDPDKAYHDIKDILEVKSSKKKFAWWWIAAGIVLCAFLGWYIWRRKKPLLSPAAALQVSPYEEAMKQLEQLEKNKPGIKQFHSALTGIFRLYLFRTKGILSLQKTTDDLVLQLNNGELEKGQFDRLAQSLRLSDFVKFAKYQPSAEDDSNCFREIKNAIITIEKTEAGSPSFGGS
jgi:hypothetical protein